MDYWQHLVWEVADHWDDFLQRLESQQPSKRLWFYSRFATASFTDVEYQPRDTLVFGCETKGLPDSITSKYSERLLRIPTGQHVRSLNLSCAAAVAGYEVSRQLGGLGG